KPVLAGDTQKLNKVKEYLRIMDKTLAARTISDANGLDVHPNAAQREQQLLLWVQGKTRSGDRTFLDRILKDVTGNPVKELHPDDLAALTPVIQDVTRETGNPLSGTGTGPTGGGGQIGNILSDASGAFLESTPLGAYSALAEDVIEVV